MNYDGIELSRNGATWISVGNPYRSDTSPDDELESDQIHARASGIGLAVGVLCACLALLAGAGGWAIIVGLIVVVPVWALIYRVLANRNQQRIDTRAHDAATFGPLRLTRGHLAFEPIADAADDLVMASVAILQSTAVRTGSLGHPKEVYQDIIETTWILLRRLVQLDNDVRTLIRVEDRLAHLTDLSAVATEIDSLDAEHRAAMHDIIPLLSQHIEYADTVADLDKQLAVPAAREELIALTRSRIDAVDPTDSQERLEARIDAAEQIIDANTTDPHTGHDAGGAND